MCKGKNYLASEEHHSRINVLLGRYPAASQGGGGGYMLVSPEAG